ncbi:upstream activation factor subunit spp27-like isoform X2 [Vitis vinifera]|uniref:upstream activation factor subunit spp27-like isoform X2 n=1 Tax=Vitis vinifera TaxID=29760 RepID=UPI002882FE96|nr:upstream activation factor subunit spp27-like isoform X2 [Vitis vinifera]
MEGRSDKVVIDVKKRGGYNKLCSLSPQLQKIVGAAELTGPQVVKKFWTYIQENSLQDPKNNRNIICDESLQELFHVDSINMFEMNKVLSKHVWQLNVEDGISLNKTSFHVYNMCEYICLLSFVSLY